MATRKKKLENSASEGWPKINQGTHLTVKTFEDGRTELVWDDEQLLKEVREAIASVKPGKVYVVEVPDMIATVTQKVIANVIKKSEKKAPTKKAAAKKTVAKKAPAKKTTKKTKE